MKKLLLSASTITILVMGINFFLKIYLSYHIDKKNLAIFYTFMDMVGIVLIIFSGFRDSLIKAYDEHLFHKVFSWYVFIFLFGMMILLSVTAFFYHQFGFEQPYVYFSGIVFVNGFAIFLSYINTAHKNYKVMLFEGLITSFGLIGSFMILKSFLDGFSLLFYSFLGSFLVRISFLYLMKKYTLKFIFSPIDKDIKQFFQNSIYSSLMYFFSGLIASLSSVIILKLYQDNSILGDFQIVVKPIFFSLIAVFVFPLNSYLFPEISKHISENRFEVVKQLEGKLLKYLFIFFILLLFGTLFTKSIISIVFPKEYQDSYVMLNIMLPFLPFVAYTTFALNIIKGANRFKDALMLRVYGSAVFFLFIGVTYKMGFNAYYLAVVFDISYIFMAFLGFYYKRQIL